MVTILNYRTGQKGTLVANFLNGGLAITSSTGASSNLPNTSILKHWFYTDLYSEAEKVGLKINHPHHMVGWQKQNKWINDDAVADFAFKGMMKLLNTNKASCLCTHHLTMLKQRHIDVLKQSYRLVGIKSDYQDAKNLDIESIFKTSNRETISPSQVEQLQKYALENNIKLPPGRPVKEIDIRCIDMGFSPTDENRAFVFSLLLSRVRAKKDWSDHDLYLMNPAYENLSIPTVGYKQLFFYPFEGIIDLKPDADLGLWAQAVKKSWVPEKVEMFGETWYPSDYGYAIGE